MGRPLWARNLTVKGSRANSLSLLTPESPGLGHRTLISDTLPDLQDLSLFSTLFWVPFTTFGKQIVSMTRLFKLLLGMFFLSGFL